MHVVIHEPMPWTLGHVRVCPSAFTPCTRATPQYDNSDDIGDAAGVIQDDTSIRGTKRQDSYMSDSLGLQIDQMSKRSSPTLRSPGTSPRETSSHVGVATEEHADAPTSRRNDGVHTAAGVGVGVGSASASASGSGSGSGSGNGSGSASRDPRKPRRGLVINSAALPTGASDGSGATTPIPPIQHTDSEREKYARLTLLRNPETPRGEMLASPMLQQPVGVETPREQRRYTADELVMSVAARDHDRVKRLLRRPEFHWAIDARMEPLGYAGLHMAASIGDEGMVELLLDAGAWVAGWASQGVPRL